MAVKKLISILFTVIFVASCGGGGGSSVTFILASVFYFYYLFWTDVDGAKRSRRSRKKDGARDRSDGENSTEVSLGEMMLNEEMMCY